MCPGNKNESTDPDEAKWLVRVANVDEKRCAIELRSKDTEVGSRYISFLPIVDSRGCVVEIFEEGGRLTDPEYKHAKRRAFGIFSEGFASGRFTIPKGA